jgi:hypothetical protein
MSAATRLASASGCAMTVSKLLTVRLFEVPARENVNAVPYDLTAAGGVLILLPPVPLLLKSATGSLRAF